MKDVSRVGALKTSTALGGGLLTLLACGAFACTEVNVNPIDVGGSAGISSGGSSGSVGRGGNGGSNPASGGSSGEDGTGGTGGTGGDSSGTGGTGDTNGGTGGTNGGTGGGDPGPINLIADPDFETGLGAWTMIAQQGTIVRSADCDGPQILDAGASDAGVSDAGMPEPPHGLWCGRGTNRSAEYQGPAYPLTGVLARGKAYTVSAYGRIANASSSLLKLTMRAICQQENGIGLPTLYDNVVPEQVATDSEWLFMTGDYVVPGTAACPVMTDLRVYIEGAPKDIDILVDDVSIYEL